MKTQVKRIINGEEKIITVNPKYAGTSKKPVHKESEVAKLIPRLPDSPIPYRQTYTDRGRGQRKRAA